MYFQILCTATMIITLCFPLGTKAGLDTMREAVNKAQQEEENARQKAQFYFERNMIEYEAALALQEKAALALKKALQDLAQLKNMYHSFHYIHTVSNKVDNEDSEDDNTDGNKHEVHSGKISTLMQESDVTATLTWDDGTETDIFGALKICNDSENPNNYLVYFAGTPADDNQQN